ncbi:MAG TPA: hypothetical protein VLS45_05625 [Methylomicrobium sp.]|nr:hypothetical protein [Methylomicrobium sp.]
MGGAQNEYWTRLNYGLVGLKETRVCIADDYWMHAIHVQLPEIPDDLDLNMNFTKPVCDGSCARLTGLLKASRTLTVTMQQTVSKMVRRIYNLIPDVTVTPSGGRRRRGLLNIIGDAYSFLFGTATESDISALTENIKKVETMAETAALDAARTRVALASFTRLEDDRIKNLRGVMLEEHKSIGAIF